MTHSAAAAPTPGDSRAVTDDFQLPSHAGNWYNLNAGVPEEYAPALRERLLDARDTQRDGVVLSLADSLGSESLPGIATWVDFVISLEFRRVLVDLSTVHSMTSRIPREFVRLHKGQVSTSGDSVIVSPADPQSPVRMLLEFMEVPALVPVFTDPDVAWSHPIGAAVTSDTPSALVPGALPDPVDPDSV